MVVREFSAINFRNYEELLVKFSDNINIIIGDNGQGKTNLVEGIYFVNHLDSFRTHRPKKLIRFGQSLAYVQARIARAETLHKARIELSGFGRKVWLDDSPIKRLSEYITSFYAVVFNPDSLHSHRHSATERRAFFNRFLSFFDPIFLREIRAFRSIHAQKNQLLKGSDKSSLLDWNVLFVEKTCDIVKRRVEIVERINGILPDLFARISGRGGHRERLGLEYLPSLGVEASQNLLVLEKAAEQEFRLGHALHGPHRDDFRLNLGGEQSDEFFSQGEYRMALLALNLAVNTIMSQHMGFHPVLILDDLFSELDPAVRGNLRDYLSEMENQIFITSTEHAEARGFPHAHIMEIRGGRVEQL